jgi:hypothetical protein
LRAPPGGPPALWPSGLHPGHAATQSGDGRRAGGSVAGGHRSSGVVVTGPPSHPARQCPSTPADPAAS